nr:AraC family transcriptional regulator [uncultured Friedmanniella sp.]
MTSSSADVAGQPPVARTLPELALQGAGFVQTVTYQAGATFGPRRLADYEFVWLLSGSAQWRLREQPGGAASDLLLVPGQLVLAPAGSIDSYQWDLHQPSRHAWVHFEILDPARLPDHRSWPLVRSLTTAPLLGALCDHLLELAGQQAPHARPRSAQLIALLLDLFVAEPTATAPARLPVHLRAALAGVQRIWRDDGLRIVEADELAAAAGVSGGHLFRLFRQHYGCGPAHALELIRLARAAVMLQRSNATLDEVAAACGFANAYHFSRRFRASYGVPPGRYRRVSPTADPLGPVRAAGLLPVAQLLDRS